MLSATVINLTQASRHLESQICYSLKPTSLKELVHVYHLITLCLMESCQVMDSDVYAVQIPNDGEAQQVPAKFSFFLWMFFAARATETTDPLSNMLKMILLSLETYMKILQQFVIRGIMQDLDTTSVC